MLLDKSSKSLAHDHMAMSERTIHAKTKIAIIISSQWFSYRYLIVHLVSKLQLLSLTSSEKKAHKRDKGLSLVPPAYSKHLL